MICPLRLLCGVVGAMFAVAQVDGRQESKPPEVRTLTYATRNGVDLLLDLYLPAVPLRRPVPVIVFLHGGGWSGGTCGERDLPP